MSDRTTIKLNNFKSLKIAHSNYLKRKAYCLKLKKNTKKCPCGSTYIFRNNLLICKKSKHIISY